MTSSDPISVYSHLGVRASVYEFGRGHSAFCSSGYGDKYVHS